jgi:tetratricopeptide (TPR) repeat protein
MKRLLLLTVTLFLLSSFAQAAQQEATPSPPATAAREADKPSPAGFVPLLLLIGFIVYRYKTRGKRAEKKRERAWAAEDALPEVSTNLHVIVESIDIFRNSKNIDTATSRYNLAVERLEDLLSRHPHRSDWQALLDALRAEDRIRLQETLEAVIDRQIEKSSLAKSVAAKINPLNKALLTLSEADDTGNYDDAWIAAKREHIEGLIHESEIGQLLETAERHEFKEDWKKAVSAYQDALFFLKKDNIPDDEQADLITKLEEKIAKLKGNC